jgi:hypothetical protein
MRVEVAVRQRSESGRGLEQLGAVLAYRWVAKAGTWMTRGDRSRRRYQKGWASARPGGPA